MKLKANRGTAKIKLEEDTDWRKIETDLQAMRSMGEKRIVDLSDKESNYFINVASFTKSLYEKPDDYEKLQTLTKKIFSNTSILPGTINSYFNGCSVETSVPRGCSKTCAGSLPLSMDSIDSSSYCEDDVLDTRIENGHYVFVRKIPEKGTRRAYIYLNLNDPTDFQGFNTKEKNALKAIGIDSIILYAQPENSNKYIGIYTNWTSVQTIKERTVSLTDASSKDVIIVPSSNYWSSRALTIFGIVFFVILFIFIIYMIVADTK